MDGKTGRVDTGVSEEWNITKKRNKLEIYVDVLRAIKIESIPTRIMYESNVSWIPLHKEIFPHLIRKRLITESVMDSKYSKKMKHMHHLTAKGRAVIAAQDDVTRNLWP